MGLRLLVILVVFVGLWPAFPAFGAEPAVTFADGSVYKGSLAINGGGTHACVSIQAGSTVDLVNSTLANCADDALIVGDDASSTNTVYWCSVVADCTITIAADKEFIGDHNAWPEAPGGDGTDRTTDNVVLTACPFRACSEAWDLRPNVPDKAVWCGGGDVGFTADILGNSIPFPGQCYPIGAYRVMIGSGTTEHERIRNMLFDAM